MPGDRLSQADKAEAVADLLKDIHRKTNGSTVGFYRKSGGRFSRNNKVIPTPMTDMKGSDLLPLLDQTDSYFTLNIYYVPPSLKAKGGMNRKEIYLSRLNACYVDLDVGRTKVEAPENHRLAGGAGLSATGYTKDMELPIALILKIQ